MINSIICGSQTKQNSTELNLNSSHFFPSESTSLNFSSQKNNQLWHSETYSDFMSEQGDDTKSKSGLAYETPVRGISQVGRDRIYSEPVDLSQSLRAPLNEIVSQHNEMSQISKNQDQSNQSPPSASASSCTSFKTKYKTEICRNWEVTGECKFADNCAFAHGDQELLKKKHVPSKYKTRLCKQYHENLYCPYGARCQFVHSTRSFSQEEGKNISYQQMLEENLNQMMRRLKNSENPDIIEFNTVCKERPRLQAFQQIVNPSSGQTPILYQVNQNQSKPGSSNKNHRSSEYKIKKTHLSNNHHLSGDMNENLIVNYSPQIGQSYYQTNYSSSPAITQQMLMSYLIQEGYMNTNTYTQGYQNQVCKNVSPNSNKFYQYQQQPQPNSQNNFYAPHQANQLGVNYMIQNTTLNAQFLSY